MQKILEKKCLIYKKMTILWKTFKFVFFFFLIQKHDIFYKNNQIWCLM